LVTLNRPERLNALKLEELPELGALWTELDEDPEVRVVILTGQGRGFCSGLDLSAAGQLPVMPLPANLTNMDRWASAVLGMRSMSKPVIAAVNGPAAGAGFALALAADVRLAGPAARFSAAFVRIGLSGGDVGMSWMLPRVVGLGHAAEILLTGRSVDAEEAARIGLVNRVVPADELIACSLELAADIARNSPFGIRLTKQVLQRNVDAVSLPAAIEAENGLQVLAAHTEDMAEALAAFVDKRPARFSGR
jgi:enoyl-CoA hydratase